MSRPLPSLTAAVRTGVGATFAVSIGLAMGMLNTVDPVQGADGWMGESFEATGSLTSGSHEPPATDTLSAHQRRRAQALLQNRVACLGCHMVNGEGGAIGPSLDGVGVRLGQDFVARMIEDPQAAMPGSNMPGQPLSPRDIALLADLLTEGEQWSGAAPAPIQAPVVPPDTTGPALYQRHCSSCHGVEGRGDGWNAESLPVTPTDHTDASHMSTRVDDALYDAIHAGGWVLDRSPRMPAFGALLTGPQIRALVAHLRTLCDCTAPAWSRDGGAVGAVPGGGR